MSVRALFFIMTFIHDVVAFFQCVVLRQRKAASLPISFITSSFQRFLLILKQQIIGNKLGSKHAKYAKYAEGHTSSFGLHYCLPGRGL